MCDTAAMTAHRIHVPFGLFALRVDVDGSTGAATLTATDALGRPVDLSEAHLDAVWGVLRLWFLKPDASDRTRGRTAFSPRGWSETLGPRAAQSVSAAPEPVLA